MRSGLVSFLLTLRIAVRSRAALQLEMIALRHQLHVLERSRPQQFSRRSTGGSGSGSHECGTIGERRRTDSYFFCLAIT
jgi:hypothetical protein